MSVIQRLSEGFSSSLEHQVTLGTIRLSTIKRVDWTSKNIPLHSSSYFMGGSFLLPYSYLSFWQGRVRCSSSFQRFVPMFRMVNRPWECPLINGGKAGKDFQKHSVTIHYSASSSALRCLVSQRVLSTFYFQTALKPWSTQPPYSLIYTPNVLPPKHRL